MTEQGPTLKNGLNVPVFPHRFSPKFALSAGKPPGVSEPNPRHHRALTPFTLLPFCPPSSPVATHTPIYLKPLMTPGVLCQRVGLLPCHLETRAISPAGGEAGEDVLTPAPAESPYPLALSV